MNIITIGESQLETHRILSGELETSEEEDECSSVSHNFQISSMITRVNDQVDKVLKDWVSPRSVSSGGHSRQPLENVMFLLSAVTVVKKEAIQSRSGTLAKSYIQLTGVQPVATSESFGHQPITWNVFGFSPSFKIILQPRHAQTSITPDLVDFEKQLKSLMSQKLLAAGVTKIKLHHTSLSIKKLKSSLIRDILEIHKSHADRLVESNSVLLEVFVSTISEIKILSKALTDLGTGLDPLSHRWNILEIFEVIVCEVKVNHCRKFLAHAGIKVSSLIEHTNSDEWSMGGSIKADSIYCKNISFKNISSCENLNSGKSLWMTLRVLSFDLECLRKNLSEVPGFCFENLENIVQISARVCDLYLQAVVPTLDLPKVHRKQDFLMYAHSESINLPNIGIIHIRMSSQNQWTSSSLDAQEIVLMTAFQHLVSELNPDIITGYNISQFDMPFIAFRKTTLEKKHDIRLDHTLGFGRKPTEQLALRRLPPEKRPGYYIHNHSKVPGRILFDMFVFLKIFTRKTGEGMLKLKNVASRNLPKNMCKMDSVKITKDIYLRFDNEQLESLARYCLRDGEIPLQLLLHSLQDLVENSIYCSPLEHALETSFRLNATIQNVVNKKKRFNEITNAIKR